MNVLPHHDLVLISVYGYRNAKVFQTYVDDSMNLSCRETIDLSRPSPPPPKAPSPPPPRPSPLPQSPPPPPPQRPSPSPKPIPSPQVPIPQDPSDSELLPRGSMCSAQRIKSDKLLAGNYVGNNFYVACKYQVGNSQDCCAICQNNKYVQWSWP